MPTLPGVSLMILATSQPWPSSSTQTHVVSLLATIWRRRMPMRLLAIHAQRSGASWRSTGLSMTQPSRPSRVRPKPT
ncbi:UNVERIFIED_CONTAM: hypothetical protein GTU68_028855 [Idotea baltica]|nr:hypothetical protein [Idotea baltica]